jgi:NodT family efflux transporter outer membrane factor (OMF) lipoprotein
MRNMRTLVSLAAFLAGCTVGPDYQPPDATLPARFSGAEPAAAAAAIAQWWRAFDDRQLDRLIEQAMRDNPDVLTAASRVHEARLQEIVAGAPLWPSLQASDQAARTHLSGNAISLGNLGTLTGGAVSSGAGNSLSSLGLPGTDFNTYQLGFDASWELDLFGKTRRGMEAARDSTGAATWNRRDTQVSLTAEVANTWFALRAAQSRLQVAEAELARQQSLLAVVQTRQRTGLATGLDVAQQDTQLTAAAAAVPPLEAEIETRRHALAVLAGEPPETLDLPVVTAATATPPTVPPGLPSDLLRRRPDIRSAERQLAAAAANIGVAVADYYPQITLTASPSLISTALSNLLTWGSRNLSLTAGLAWPLFNAGTTTAKVGIANEHQQQALLAYRKTVLTALRDVEDALSQYQSDTDRQAALHRSLSAAGAAADIAGGQYRAGLIPFSTVLTTEAALTSAQDQSVQADASLNQDLVALYKALGGGWSEETTEAAR